nr:immunoglobulin light chain junction region [Macaca mulatta]
DYCCQVYDSSAVLF